MKPNFEGQILQSGDWTRHLIFPAAVKYAMKRSPRDRDLEFLEIGVWAGYSTNSWIKALKKTDRNFHITIIDNWNPEYSEQDFKRSDHYALMSQLVKNGEIEDIFRANMDILLASDQITIIKGNSKDILKTFPDKYFDLISIDANHLYESVLEDLSQAQRILGDRGLLVGDDLEVQFGDIANFPEEASEYFTDSKTGLGFHPGVTKAVWEEYGRVMNFRGMFLVDKNGSNPKEIKFPSKISIRIARKPESTLGEYIRMFIMIKELIDFVHKLRIKQKIGRIFLS